MVKYSTADLLYSLMFVNLTKYNNSDTISIYILCKSVTYKVN